MPELTPEQIAEMRAEKAHVNSPLGVCRCYFVDPLLDTADAQAKRIGELEHISADLATKLQEAEDAWDAETKELERQRDAALVLACTMVCAGCGDKRVFPPEDAEGAIRQYRLEHVCPVAKERERHLSGMREALEKAEHGKDCFIGTWGCHDKDCNRSVEGKDTFWYIGHDDGETMLSCPDHHEQVWEYGKAFCNCWKSALAVAHPVETTTVERDFGAGE